MKPVFRRRTAALVLCAAIGNLGCDEAPQRLTNETKQGELSAVVAPSQEPKEHNARRVSTNLSDPRPFIVTRNSVRTFVAKNGSKEAPPLDGWGLVLRMQGQEIRSAGPDRKLNTSDDLVLGLDGKAFGPQRP